jgi:hypothetical protein
MRRFFFVIVAAAVVVPAVVAARQWAPPRPDRARYVLADREALLLMTPELVAPPAVVWAAWSPGGRYVLARREYRLTRPVVDPEPAGETSLVIWSRKTRRSQEVWKGPAGSLRFEAIEWLAGTDVALAVVGATPAARGVPPPPRVLLRVDAARGQARPGAALADNERLLVAPAGGLAVLIGHPLRTLDGSGRPAAARGQRTLRVVRADATTGPLVTLPEGFVGEMNLWTGSGSVLALSAPRHQPGQPPSEEWYGFDLRTGRLERLERHPEPYRPAAPAWPYRLRQAAASAREAETSVSLRPLWLETLVPGEYPRALVCADSDFVVGPSPDGGMVLYGAEGAAWIVPVTRVPRAEFLAGLRAVQQQAAMQNAKQLGLALAMYSQDYDEVYPPAGADAREVLLPYLGNSGVFNDPSTNALGFVFDGAGLSLASLEKPAETLVGYLTGPGGRAVIYADGHVRWETNP